MAARANKDADALLSAQQELLSADQEAAEGAHRLEASLSGMRNLGGATAGGAVTGAKATPVSYHGLTS
ncbi:hypothetical protein SAMN04487766_12137 [Actinomyces ruminicola]|uniref:Uncharacterized protein n=2 Tax=Actinomyces ruminicola TaxID=332524 RepID=A0A1H0A3X5_9ACTO|nr:hypothetical protein SAMN04487766_12137 [Actinomyces ruminicola]